MKRFIPLALLFCVLFQGIGGRIAGEDVQTSKYVPPNQLRGLRDVIYAVGLVGTEFPERIQLREEIEDLAATILSKAGIAISNKTSSTLMTVISSYPIELEGFKEYVLIDVSMELREEVLLVRRPWPRGGVSGITWSRQIVEVIPREEIKSFILIYAKIFLDDFVSDLKAANSSH